MEGPAHDIESLQERDEIPIMDISEELDKPKLNPKFILKKDLIVNIKKLTNKYSDRKLQRMKRADLQKLLGGHFEENMEAVVEPIASDKLVVGTMYRVVLSVCSIMEGLSKKFHPGGYCIKGWAECIDQTKAHNEMLRQVLFEVYQENAAFIQGYMSKEKRLMLVLFLSGSSCVCKYKHEATMEQNVLSCRTKELREIPTGAIPGTGGKPPRLNGGSHRLFFKPGERCAMGVSNGKKESAQTLLRAGRGGHSQSDKNKRVPDSKIKTAGENLVNI